MSIAIVIPFFRNPHLHYEEASVKQAIKILAIYDHFLVIPKGFNCSNVQAWYNKASKPVTIIEFEADYFESVYSYNKLMLSASFYETFLKYKYVLIYQTDAWIFRDELLYWIDKGYDYVGAPWIDWIYASMQEKNKTRWGKIQWMLGRRRFDTVGNGGFSLRKTGKMLEVITLLNETANNYPHNEDFFFAFEAKKQGIKIRIPSVKEALGFAFDENPDLSFEEAGKQLPMGCHGWPRFSDFYKNLDDTITVAYR